MADDDGLDNSSDLIPNFEEFVVKLDELRKAHPDWRRQQKANDQALPGKYPYVEALYDLMGESAREVLNSSINLIDKRG